MFVRTIQIFSVVVDDGRKTTTRAGKFILKFMKPTCVSHHDYIQLRANTRATFALCITSSLKIANTVLPCDTHGILCTLCSWRYQSSLNPLLPAYECRNGYEGYEILIPGNLIARCSIWLNQLGKKRIHRVSVAAIENSFRAFTRNAQSLKLWKGFNTFCVYSI